MSLFTDQVQTLDFNQALAMFRQNAEQRREALRDWERAIRAAAEADAEYTRAYAKAIVSAEGTASVRDALAKDATAELRAKRDVLAGLTKVCQERVRQLEGERANINGLVDWSKRLDPGVGG